MNEKEKKQALRKLIKEALDTDNAKNEPTDALTDEDMKNSQQELPPEDMLEKIKKEIKKAQN
ncbi:MAG: hypothetical protein IJC69_06955 [Clostridia bacterium]|nr:hypothetical protein [Clostridia bacterium]